MPIQAARYAREVLVNSRDPRVSGGDCVAEVLCVPIDDDRGPQVGSCHAVVLTLGGSIADFALTTNAQGVFQGVVRLPLIPHRTDPTPGRHLRHACRGCGSLTVAQRGSGDWPSWLFGGARKDSIKVLIK